MEMLSTLGVGFTTGSLQQPTHWQAARGWGRRRRRIALHLVVGLDETTGAERSPGNDSTRRLSCEAGMPWPMWENLVGRVRAASQAA